MQQYVGEVLQVHDHYGHWYPIVSIDFHEHAITGVMVSRQVYVFVVDLSMQGILSKGWITRVRGCWETWKVRNCTEGSDRISRRTI